MQNECRILYEYKLTNAKFTSERFTYYFISLEEELIYNHKAIQHNAT